MVGLQGIQKGYTLPDPVEENIYKMSNSRQKKFDIRTLPRNLEEAVKNREIDEYNKNVSGEFDKQVSGYEIKKYLPSL
jgi:glutamine synthetase